MSKNKEEIKGFKGFDKDMKCRDFQYEVGKEYEQEGDIKACEKGFHFCEHPLDVFSYYAPNTSQFAEVTGSGSISKEENGDNKIAVSKIHISAKITLQKLIKGAIEFTFNKVKWSKEASSSGDYSGASSSGYKSGASSSGYKSGASSSGNYSGASSSGNYSGASSSGNYSGASSSGDYSGASSSGNCSGASSSGDYSGASSSGYKSGASSSGYKSGASSSGDCSGASSSGDYSGASSSGYKSGASSSGDYSGASSSGYKSGASSSGYKSGASSSGDYSGASSSGNCSGASSSGDYSTAEAGKGCIAVVIGYQCKAKGKIGSWLVLSEAEKVDGITFLKDVKTVAVDGVEIKEDTFYCLKNGKISEAI